MKPDLVAPLGLQCCVYGSIAALAAGISRYVNAMTGLGYVFTSATWRTHLLRAMLKRMLPSLQDRQMTSSWSKIPMTERRSSNLESQQNE